MLRSPLRSPLQPALRSPFARGVGTAAGRVLDFASLTAAQLQSRFGWTRSGAGTMTDSGTAVRYGAHNLLLHGADITQASWTKIAVTALSATEFTETAANAQHQVFRSFSISPGIYTQIIRVRPKTGTRFVSVYPQGGSIAAAVFNLQAGTRTVTFGGGFIDGGIQLMPDGFYRCWVTGHFTGTTLFAVIYTSNNGADPAPGFAGDVGVSFDVQLQRVVNGPIDDATNDLTTVTTTAPVYLMRTPDHTHGVPGLLLEGARSQLLESGALGAQLVTQTKTVTAVAHTLSFFGTGTVTLTGAHAATVVGTGATALRTFTFTPSAGSLTLTVTGTVTDGQLEAGSYATSRIPNPTTGTMLRVADYPTVIFGDELTRLIGNGTDFVLELEYRLNEATASGLIFELAGAADRCTVNGTIELSASQCIFWAVGYVAQATLTAVSPFGVYNKVAIGYSANLMRVCINGGTVQKDVSGAIGGTLGRLAISHQIGTSLQHKNMSAFKVIGIPGAGSTMTDAALQALTV